MDTMNSSDLIVLDQFDRALSEAETLGEVQAIRNKAEAVRHWAKNARMSLEVQNRAAELKLRAERKAGRILALLKLRGGDRKTNGGQHRVNLSDLGVTQNESKRWQKQASISEDDFQYYVRRVSEFGEELSAAGLLRLARQIQSGRAESSATVKADFHNGSAADRTAPTCEPADTIPRGPSEHCGDETPRECVSGHSAEELTELLSELLSHHALLCRMLAPLCSGEQESWLPGQRRGTSHYLSEIGRVLARLAPTEFTGTKRYTVQSEPTVSR